MNAQTVGRTEKSMREEQVPTPKSAEELQSYIAELVAMQHDYGTCVYAMSLAATATFNYVAHALGVTGFQASCADLDIVRRTRRLKGPFMLLDSENALYPQYDLRAKLDEFLTEIRPWLAEQARANLDKSDVHAHPDVLAHWRKLAAPENEVEQ